jgi:DMSO/TMAO reductase YedYZ molybdopterin-dependent catalytic subunit
MHGNIKTVTLALAAILVVAIAVWQFYPQAPEAPEEPSTNLPELSVTLVALNGTEYPFDNTTLAELPSYEAQGGFVTSTGSIVGPYNCTGVKITTLCDLVGGLSNKTSLRVTAEDGYSIVFTYDQVQGDLLTFGPSTGDEATKSAPLHMVLAYFVNGDPLPYNEGPLRIVVLGSEGLLTEGHNWVKFVDKLEIRPVYEEWVLDLYGAITERMDRSTFESGANCHAANWTDGEENSWSGIPLWLLVGRVDDSQQHGSDAFNRTLVDKGYVVQIVAADNYTIQLDASRIGENDAILVAHVMNGLPLPEKYWPLRLVGADLITSEMIRNVVEIQLVFESET